ncbi:MAG: PepSY domain-containing protein [Verrucomicrobia bacterium]|nr:PepSY domain-containing protein [Verrucomicrobiota bacterium]
MAGGVLGEEIPERDWVAISNIYYRALAVVRQEVGQPVAVPSDLTRDMISVEQARYTTTLNTVFPSSLPIHIVMETGSGRIYTIGNKVVERLTEDCEPHPAPTLSVDKAMEKARSYLSRLKLDVPPGARLRRVTYSRHSGSWSVVWERRTAGYAYFGPEAGRHGETVGLRFYERHGLGAYWSTMYLPSPSNVTVKIAAEGAARLAVSYAGRIMETPFYKMNYGPGFTIVELGRPELQIVAPNWLADSSRAVFLRDTSRPEGLPRYTRLAWIVTFKTSDVDMTTKRAGPDVYVYVDAATGEVLGGSFS